MRADKDQPKREADDRAKPAYTDEKASGEQQALTLPAAHGRTSEPEHLQAHLDADPAMLVGPDADLADVRSILLRELGESLGLRQNDPADNSDIVARRYDDEAERPEAIDPSDAPPRTRKLHQLQAYLDGDADPATAAAIEAELDDPNSLLRKGLEEAVGPRPGDPPPGDWHAFLFSGPRAFFGSDARAADDADDGRYTSDRELDGAEDVEPSAPKRPSKLQKLQKYLNGTADPETAAEMEAELEDPNSTLLQGIQEACGPRPGDPPPGDWHAYLFPNAAKREPPTGGDA